MTLETLAVAYNDGQRGPNGFFDRSLSVGLILAIIGQVAWGSWFTAKEDARISQTERDIGVIQTSREQSVRDRNGEIQVLRDRVNTDALTLVKIEGQIDSTLTIVRRMQDVADGLARPPGDGDGAKKR